MESESQNKTGIFKVEARAKTFFSIESGLCRSSVASSGITGTGDQAELHFSEAWFHGNLERGRETAEQMLYDNAHMGDGTFIVRKSQVIDTVVLSFKNLLCINH